MRSPASSHNVLMSVIASTPINGTARSVTAQGGADDIDRELTRDEIVCAIERMVEIRERHKDIIGLRGPNSHRNFMYQWNKFGQRMKRLDSEERREAARNYVLIGQQIQTMTRELARRKAEEKAARVSQ